MIFENSLSKANFGQNIRDSPNGSLTADSRSLQTATLKCLEKTMLDSGSVSSKGSKKSKLAKRVKSRTRVNTVLSTRADKCKLQQEEAAFKVKLAYIEHEKALEMEKIRNEQKLEELKLKRKI